MSSAAKALKYSIDFNAHQTRWGPITLDLDILLYGNEIINDPNLTIPHPHMHERNFVLVPLGELLMDS